MEALQPPDVEGAVIAALADVAGWVGTRYPADDDGQPVVRVAALGGSVRDVVVTQQEVLIECWSPISSLAAMGVAQSAYAALVASIGTWQGGVWMRHVEAALPVNFPDTSRPERHRYQFTATVHARMEVAR